MTFRKIRQWDIPALFAVRTSTVENSFTIEELEAAGITEASVANRLQTTHTGWLCEIEGAVVGFSMGDKQTGELWVIAVRPQWEGKGIGSRLLRHIEGTLARAGCHELWLLTSADRSMRAHAFYRAHGWSDQSEADGELRMEKSMAGHFHQGAHLSAVRMDTADWHRVGEGSSYFALRYRGASDGSLQPYHHYHAIAHLPGTSRTKLFFAIPCACSVAMIHLLRDGAAGDEQVALICPNRGHITAKVLEDGKRSITFDVGPSGGIRGLKGGITAPYQTQPRKTTTHPPTA